MAGAGVPGGLRPPRRTPSGAAVVVRARRPRRAAPDRAAHRRGRAERGRPAGGTGRRGGGGRRRAHRRAAPVRLPVRQRAAVPLPGVRPGRHGGAGLQLPPRHPRRRQRRQPRLRTPPGLRAPAGTGPRAGAGHRAALGRAARRPGTRGHRGEGGPRLLAEPADRCRTVPAGELPSARGAGDGRTGGVRPEAARRPGRRPARHRRGPPGPGEVRPVRRTRADAARLLRRTGRHDRAGDAQPAGHRGHGAHLRAVPQHPAPPRGRGAGHLVRRRGPRPGAGTGEPPAPAGAAGGHPGGPRPDVAGRHAVQLHPLPAARRGLPHPRHRQPGLRGPGGDELLPGRQRHGRSGGRGHPAPHRLLGAVVHPRPGAAVHRHLRTHPAQARRRAGRRRGLRLPRPGPGAPADRTTAGERGPRLRGTGTPRARGAGRGLRGRDLDVRGAGRGRLALRRRPARVGSAPGRPRRPRHGAYGRHGRRAPGHREGGVLGDAAGHRLSGGPAARHDRPGPAGPRGRGRGAPVSPGHPGDLRALPRVRGAGHHRARGRAAGDLRGRRGVPALHLRLDGPPQGGLGAAPVPVQPGGLAERDRQHG